MRYSVSGFIFISLIACSPMITEEIIPETPSKPGMVSSGVCPASGEPLFREFEYKHGTLTLSLFTKGLLYVESEFSDLEPNSKVSFSIDLDGDGKYEGLLSGKVDTDGTYNRSGNLPTCAGNLSQVKVW